MLQSLQIDAGSSLALTHVLDGWCTATTAAERFLSAKSSSKRHEYQALVTDPLMQQTRYVTAPTPNPREEEAALLASSQKPKTKT